MYLPEGMSAGGVGLQKNHEPPETARRVRTAASDNSKCMIIRYFMAIRAWHRGRSNIVEFFEPAVKRVEPRGGKGE
jgi:hypothetical protein